MTGPAKTFRDTRVVCLILGLITLALYLPSLRHEFLLYDDQQYVTENLQVKAGLTWKGFIWAFGYHAGNWHPLAWLSHMIDCQLYGLNPAGHHLTNILLHTANTVLLFAVLCRLTGAIWRSASVAALFGWHPLHVESVAWVAERKDVLCAFFWMLTLWTYTRFATDQRSEQTWFKSGRYWQTLIGFGLALMAKPMAVTLPFVLFLLDLWPLQRLTPANFRQTVWRLIVEKMPFLCMSFATCLLTLSAQEQAIASTASISVFQRVCHALTAYVHYASAMFFPVKLSVYYPYVVSTPIQQAVAAGLILGIVTVFAVLLVQKRPFVVTGWFWFLGTLVPIIGLVQVGDQAWADRYTYLPLIGLFIITVWLAAEIVKNRHWLGCISTLIALVLLAGTTLQLRHWRNTQTLFTHAARVVPNNYMAITMLGSLLAREGKLDEAMENYRAALQLQPGFPEAHFFLGNAYDQQGRLDEAIAEYQQALWFKPMMETTHILLGVALNKKKQINEAAAHFDAAIKINPESAIAHNNLARIRHTQGDLNAAIRHYFLALQLDPQLAQARNNYGIALLQKGRLAEGVAELRESLRLNPTNSESQLNLALALNQQQDWAAAAELFAKSGVNSSLQDANAHYQFGRALDELGKIREAMSHYAQALLIKSDFPEALDGLAWILSTSPQKEFRNPDQALGMAQSAVNLSGQNNPNFLITLAAAYAVNGRYVDAVQTIEKAQSMTVTNQPLNVQCQNMLEAFKVSRAWVEP